MDRLRPQRIDRNGQHQRRVHAARQAQQHAWKAVFAYVVAQAQYQGVPQIGIGFVLWCNFRFKIDS